MIVGGYQYHFNKVLFGQVEEVLLIISGGLLLTVMDYGLLFLIQAQKIG
jgi:hypothetical protein